MTHYFEKNIVDAKDIYTDYLIGAITQAIYDGFKLIYNDAINMENQYIEGSKISSEIKNPGVIKIFQYYMLDIRKWSDSMIDTETQRVRHESGCADIFDDLIKAVVKSNIIVLTYNASKKTCKIVLEKLHEKIESKFFIHSCYLECMRILVNHPTLFYHDFPNIVLKDNERKIYQLIIKGIKRGIQRVLPMRKILTEYLSKDYIEEEDSDTYYKIKNMLKNKNMNHDEGGRMVLIESSETSAINNFVELDNEPTNLEELIYGIKPEDTVDIEIIDLPQKNTNDTFEHINDNKMQEIIMPTINTNNSPQHKISSVVSPKRDNDEHINNNLEQKHTDLEQTQPQEEIDEIEMLFGTSKSTKGSKSTSKSILSEAFNAVKNTDDNNDINIIKSAQKKSEYSDVGKNNNVLNKSNNDDFFNSIAKI